MLLDTTRNRSPRLAAARLGFMVSGAAILTVAAICSGPRIVLGQNAPAPAQATTLVSVTPSLPPSESTLPVAAVVSVAPDAENPPGVDPGPKYKPGKAQSGDNTPAPPATPIAPLPPKMAIAAAPAHVPHPPHAVTVSSGDSLEDRLDRLEKAVQALLDSKGGKPGASYYSPKPESFNYSLNWDRKELEHNKELAKSLAEMEKNKSRAELNKQWNLADPKWKMEFKDSITRETARAGEEVRRAERDAQKAMAEQKRSTRTQIRLGTRMQLDALRKQLDALEHQKDSLHREIERLEKEQGRGKGDSDEEDSSEQDSSADVQ